MPFAPYLLFLVFITFTMMNYTNNNDRLREAKSPSAIREGYISVLDGNVWYRIVGASRKKIPLLILHGGPGVPHDYLESLELLSDERPIIFYDQLGCGNSDRPDDRSLWTIERFVEELAQVRAALQLKRVHVLGHSWGVMLATDYMLTKTPSGVVSLILSAPCLSAARFIADQKKYLLEFPKVIQQIVEESEASGDFSSSEYQDAKVQYDKLHTCRLDPWPECMTRAQKKAGIPVYEHMRGYGVTINGTLKNYERTDRLKELTTPALFTCGQYDKATPESTTYYHSLVSESEIAVFEDASHVHHIEKPQHYLQVVRDFLHRVERLS